MDFSKVTNIVFDGVDHFDQPDYCDAFIISADYDGEPMNEEQLGELNENRDFISERLLDI